MTLTKGKGNAYLRHVVSLACTFAAVAFAPQLRARWTYFLSSDGERGPFTAEEDKKLVSLVDEYGTRWSHIARKLGNRNDQEVKQHYRKVLRRLGLADAYYHNR